MTKDNDMSQTRLRNRRGECGGKRSRCCYNAVDDGLVGFLCWIFVPSCIQYH